MFLISVFVTETLRQRVTTYSTYKDQIKPVQTAVQFRPDQNGPEIKKTSLTGSNQKYVNRCTSLCLTLCLLIYAVQMAAQSKLSLALSTSLSTVLGNIAISPNAANSAKLACVIWIHRVLTQRKKKKQEHSAKTLIRSLTYFCLWSQTFLLSASLIERCGLDPNHPITLILRGIVSAKIAQSVNFKPFGDTISIWLFTRMVLTFIKTRLRQVDIGNRCVFAIFF